MKLLLFLLMAATLLADQPATLRDALLNRQVWEGVDHGKIVRMRFRESVKGVIEVSVTGETGFVERRYSGSTAGDQIVFYPTGGLAKACGQSQRLVLSDRCRLFCLVFSSGKLQGYYDEDVRNKPVCFTLEAK